MTTNYETYKEALQAQYLTYRQLLASYPLDHKKVKHSHNQTPKIHDLILTSENYKQGIASIKRLSAQLADAADLMKRMANLMETTAKIEVPLEVVSAPMIFLKNKHQELLKSIQQVHNKAFDHYRAILGIFGECQDYLETNERRAAPGLIQPCLNSIEKGIKAATAIKNTDIDKITVIDEDPSMPSIDNHMRHFRI